MPRRVKDVLAELAMKERVIMIGGLAVIGHGFSRPTKDADVWLDPTKGLKTWLEWVQKLIHPPEKIVTLPGWRELRGRDLFENVEGVGMVRIEGFDVPLDLFYRPNGLEIDDFERVWGDAAVLEDGTRLPSLLDLLCTKEETNRQHDFNDASFLIGKARIQQGQKLAESKCESEATAIIDAFFDYSVLEQGLKNPVAEVREVIWREVEILAADGDPFAKEMLEGRGGE